MSALAADPPTTDRPQTPACPPWCEADHLRDRYAIDHTRVTGSVIREPYTESLLVELERAPVSEARALHAALDRAVSLAEQPPPETAPSVAGAQGA